VRNYFHIRKKIKFLLVLIFLIFYCTGNAHAALVGWDSKVTVTIDNSAGAELTDYQVSISIDTTTLISEGKMLSDGADIRFTDSDDNTLLSYWIEEGTLNTASTVLWIKVPTIAATSTKDIYLYYGKADAAAVSSIDDTFIFGDDFSGGGVDLAKWEDDTAQFSVAGGYLTGTNTSYNLQSVDTFSNPVSIETRTIMNTHSGSGHMSIGFHLATNNCLGFLEQNGRYYYRDDGSWRSRTTFDVKSWHRIRFSIDSTDNGDLLVESSGVDGGSSSQTYGNDVTNEPIRIGQRYDNCCTGQAYDQDWDWIFVREHADTEPTVTATFPIDRIVLSTTLSQLFQDYPSYEITLETQDETGTAAEVSADRVIDLTSTSGGGQFSLTNTPFNVITQVTVPSGESSVTFYYKDSSTGTPTITAAENPSLGWTDGTLAFTVLDLELGSDSVDIEIDNDSNASELTDFQVSFTINTSALVAQGLLQADGDDIRFIDSDGVTVLPYWIQEPTINTDETTIWVKVPTIPASDTKTITMHYNESDATGRDSITDTFVFGDDFSGGAVDTDKWTEDTGNFSVADGYLTGTNTSFNLESVDTFSNPTVVEARTLMNTHSGSGHMSVGFYRSSTNCLGFLEQNNRYYYRDDGSWRSRTTFDVKSWHRIRFAVDGSDSGQMDAWSDGVDGGESTQTFDNEVLNEPIRIGQRYDNCCTGQAYDQDWDWIFVREHTDTEPTVAAQFPIDRIVLTTDYTDIYQNMPSYAITLETQDVTQAASNVTADTTINLTSTSAGGLFSLSNTTFAAVTSVTILEGESSITIYYKDSSIGTPTITAAENPSQGWTDDTLDLSVTDFLLKELLLE